MQTKQSCSYILGLGGIDMQAAFEHVTQDWDNEAIEECFWMLLEMKGKWLLGSSPQNKARTTTDRIKSFEELQ